jgi:hypothetical protein
VHTSDNDWWLEMSVSEIIFKYWLDWVLGIFSGGLLFLLRLWYKRLRATELGVQALLRNEIIKSYNHFIAQQEIPIHERDNINKLFKEYENLGGNGTISHLMNELSDLPVKRA